MRSAEKGEGGDVPTHLKPFDHISAVEAALGMGDEIHLFGTRLSHYAEDLPSQLKGVVFNTSHAVGVACIDGVATGAKKALDVAEGLEKVVVLQHKPVNEYYRIFC